MAYLSALAEVGRYEDALEAVSQAPPAILTELANTAGEILYELGQIDRAREQFVRSVQGGAVDRNSARLNLAIIEWSYGDRDAAFAAFDSFIDLYTGPRPSPRPTSPPWQQRFSTWVFVNTNSSRTHSEPTMRRWLPIRVAWSREF